MASERSANRFISSNSFVRCRVDKRHEQWMRTLGPALELGVKLTTQEPRMLRQLENLDKVRGRVNARDVHALSLKHFSKRVLKFKSMPMSLRDLYRAIRAVRKRALFET